MNYYAIIFIFESIFFLLISIKMYNDKNNPLLIFNLWWTVTVFISLFGFRGINIPGDHIYFIFLIGSISFNLSIIFITFLTKFNNLKKEKMIPSYPPLKMELPYKIALFIVTFYLIIKSINLILLLISGYNYSDIRSIYFSDITIKSRMEYLFLIYFILPMMISSIIYFPIMVIKSKINILYFFLFLFNLIMYIFISGGRMILFETSIIILFLVLNSEHKKIRNRMIFLVIFMIFVAVYVSSLRGGTLNILYEIIEKLIVNFTGSFAYLEVLIDQNSIPIGSMYGKATFSGISDILISALRYLDLTVIESAKNEIGSITANFVHIGSYSYNAMPTMYYFMILDFSYFGIVLGSVLLSTISFLVYRICILKKSYRFLSMYMLVLIIIFQSTMRWTLAFSEYLIAALILYILFNKTDRINKRKIICQIH